MVSFTLYVSTQKQKNNVKETQNVLKSHMCFLKKMTIYFQTSYLFLFLVHFQQFKVLWVHQVRIYINYLRSKGKGKTNKIHEEKEFVEF
jgi:hypothetical protein